MQCRERFLRTLMFKSVDRIPLVEWDIRKATMDAWILQGYPEGVSPQSFFSWDTNYINMPINTRMYPAFEEIIIEKTDQYKIWQDNLGAIRKDFLLDATPGFVTRSWLSFPVKERKDFLEMKKRFDSGEETRYPSDWKLKAQIYNRAPVPNHLSIPFLFWVARDWMGFEGLCYAFYDMPELVEEMFEFITDFVIETMKRGIKEVDIDMVELKEDMAYKHAPMISPDMFRKYMLPQYIRIVDFLKGNGAKFVYVDCDGDPGDLIPLWMEAGVDGISPCEIAAGNDMLKLRQKYPDFAFWGGIDKRELAKDRKAIYHEVMSKVPDLIEKGGYIPHVDHAIPPDVSLDNYLYYREILTKVADGEPVDKPNI